MLYKKEVINIAKDLIHKKDYSEAEKLLLEASADDSDLIIAGMLADLYIKMRRIDDAERYVGLILNREPNNHYALQKKGDLLALKGEYGNALGIFLDIHKRGDDAFFLLKRISKTYFLLNDNDKAVEYALKAKEKHADNADAWYHLFYIYQKTGNTEKAKEAIEKAVELAPGNEFYYSQMLSLRMNEEKIDPSEIEEMLEISEEENPALLKLLAERYKKEEEYEKAVQIYKRLISLDGSEFNKKNLAYLYYRMKAYSEAFKIFISLSDALFLDNIFLSTVISSARERDEKEELLNRMITLANGSKTYKKLWGRIKKLSNYLESGKEHNE